MENKAALNRVKEGRQEHPIYNRQEHPIYNRQKDI
jgi:hypothetical protein